MEEILSNQVKLTRNQIQERIMIALYQYLFYISNDEKPDVKELIIDVFGASLPQIDDFDTQSTMLLDWIKKVYQLTKKSKFELSFNYRYT